MTINEKLLPNWDYYEYYYDCSHESIKDFLMNNHKFIERQSMAITFIGTIMKNHNKQELLTHVSELARIEHGIRELEPWVRDHVVHAMLSYLLGKNIIGRCVDTFQWKLAGLFHDVGYPTQIAKDLLKSYADKINEIRNRIGVTTDNLHFTIVLQGLEKLQNSADSFALIQNYLDKWGLKINSRNVYDSYIKDGKICHGMISALCVLHIIDLLYQKNNPHRETLKYSGWSQEYFDNDVVPACAAIFIHNLPAQYFRDAKISLKRSPIAYLLKLSDCLQDWERPSKNNRNGFSSSLYDIEINNNKLLFSAPPERKNKIANEVEGCISSEHIIIK